jgi:hypothetical protein
METHQLIAKIEANRAYYVTYANQCITELQRKYKAERHPDGRSLIIHNVGLDILEQICKLYGCSGMVGVNSIVVTNFGYYR